jgi:isoquinoline 1-oxidoreductase beta subunit
MGQGIYTSLPMLLNEELEADWSKIKVEAAPVDAAYNHTQYGVQMTGGSTTTPSEWERFRKMGAMARLMLVDAAAQKWGVPASECRVQKGVVIHSASGKKATYGSLADAASQLKPPADIPLKDPKQFTLIGKPVRRLDTPSKINGTAQFGLDVRLPGMFLPVARPPVFGASRKFRRRRSLKFPESAPSNKFHPASLSSRSLLARKTAREKVKSPGTTAKTQSFHLANARRFFQTVRNSGNIAKNR